MRKDLLLTVLPLLLSAALLGCGESNRPGGSSKGVTGADSAAGKAAADDLAGLKELSPEDRKLAEKQKYCPKTGELLGSMGTPDKITLKGRVVFLCCPGCEDEVKKDPEKYLKKLDELLAKK